MFPKVEPRETLRFEAYRHIDLLQVTSLMHSRPLDTDTVRARTVL